MHMHKRKERMQACMSGHLVKKPHSYTYIHYILCVCLCLTSRQEHGVRVGQVRRRSVHPAHEGLHKGGGRARRRLQEAGQRAEGVAQALMQCDGMVHDTSSYILHHTMRTGLHFFFLLPGA